MLTPRNDPGEWQAMMTAVMVTAMGLGMLALRPCRDREARAPRTAVAMLLLSAGAVWIGSFGLVLVAVSGSSAYSGGLVAACGHVLGALLLGGLGWWQNALLLAWFVLLPGRGIWTVATDANQSRRLRSRARANRLSTGPVRSTDPWIVPDLLTPAITLGLLRPIVIIDADFWATADNSHRDIVLAHEQAHRRGHHGIVVALAQFLTTGLHPWPTARHVEECVRRHVEALADDAAAHRHDPHLVGVVLGHVALRSSPTHGLGAAGDTSWRVKRLIAPTRASTWRDVLVLGAITTMMAAALLIGVQTASAEAATLLSPNFCVI